jgi:hypothetical protein
MELLEIFKGKLIECGDYYFIPTFLVDQYPAGISSEKPLIVSVRKELESLFNHYPIIQESLPNDYRIIKVKEKVMVKDKEKVKEKKILSKETIKAVINSIDEKDLHQLQLFIKNNCSNISKIKEQLTFEQASKLWEEVNHQVLGDVIAAMENKADLTKKYKSVYLTIHNWVKNQKSHGQRNSNSSENRFADLEQQLERSLQGLKFEI